MTLQELLDKAKVPQALDPWALQFLPIFGGWALTDIQAWIDLAGRDEQAAYELLLQSMTNEEFVAEGHALAARAGRGGERRGRPVEYRPASAGCCARLLLMIGLASVGL